MASGSLHSLWTHQQGRLQVAGLHEGAIIFHSSLYQIINSDNNQRVNCRARKLSNVQQQPCSAHHFVVKVRREGFELRRYAINYCMHCSINSFLESSNYVPALDSIVSQVINWLDFFLLKFKCQSSDHSSKISTSLRDNLTNSSPGWFPPPTPSVTVSPRHLPDTDTFQTWNTHDPADTFPTPTPSQRRHLPAFEHPWHPRAPRPGLLLMCCWHPVPPTMLGVHSNKNWL